MTVPLWTARAVLVAASLGLWFWSQALIGRRALKTDGIGDRVLDFTSPIHTFLTRNPKIADRFLIGTSLLIDALGLFLILSSLFGPTIRPFVGMLVLFGLRQICQGLCALPQPPGMIWRDPGVPSLFVTYGVANDFFFSGHTAIAVYGCLELWRVLGPVGAAAGILIAVTEASAVLVLRAHYTMDVFTGAIVALWAFGVAGTLAGPVDTFISMFTH